MTFCLRILFLLTCLSSVVHADQSEDISQFAKSAAWRRGLFYVARGHRDSSVVVSPEFFSSGQAGRTDPQLELISSLKLFREAKTTDQGAGAAQCRFPFRYKMLRAHFSIPQLPPCSEFETWRKKYEPSGLSLVYASQYISNPSSVFGHSFLVTTSAHQVRALWQTYNYAASMPDGVSSFSYAFGGLSGWYSGDFSVMPFYERLFYYGNVENRDLWIYPVKLTSDQLDSALKLLWEIVHGAKFTYYFLDENCAGALLRTFAAIFPDDGFSENLPLYVHPIEIIKALDHHDKIGEPEFIASQYGALRKKYLHLSSHDQNSFNTAVRAPTMDISIETAPLAEALMDYTSYEGHEHQGDVPAELIPLERRAFVARAKFSVATLDDPQENKKTNSNAPHLSHDSMAFDFGTSAVNQRVAGDVMYRVALHGALDPQPGFLKNSVFELLKFSASFDNQKIWIKDFTFLNMENLQPFWRTEPKLSWRIQLHQIENLLTDDRSDSFFTIRASAGTSFDFENCLGDQLMTVMASASVNVGSDLPQRHERIGPELGYRLHSKRISAYANVAYTKALLEGDQSLLLEADIGFGLALSHGYELMQETQWAALNQSGQTGSRFGLSLRHYF